MTDLYNGMITQLLGGSYAYDPDIRAIAYAILQEKQRIMDLARTTRTMAVIEELPEAILDVLAVELRTPYYSADLSIEEKRSVIKNTLVWFLHAGTPSAVEEMIAAIFGQGDIVEWFDFTEEPKTPGTFDIVTDTRMTEDIADRFTQIVSRVKNVRSHIRRVMVERHGTQDVYIGSGLSTAPETNVLNSTDATSSSHGGKATIGAGGASAPHESILNHAPARERTTNGIAHIGAALTAEDNTVVLNGMPPGTAQIGLTQRIFSAAVAHSKTIIL